MHFTALLAGSILLAFVLLDAFQTIILPRAQSDGSALPLFFLVTWYPWTALVGFLPSRRSREQLYSAYGPLALLVLSSSGPFF